MKQLIPRPHRGHIRSRPDWTRAEAVERHERFAAAAGVHPQEYVHPAVVAASLLSDKARALQVGQAIVKTHIVSIPGTTVRLMFWKTVDNETLVLKQDLGRKPGSLIFATRYPGAMTFEQLVEKYQRLAERFAERLAHISVDDLSKAA